MPGKFVVTKKNGKASFSLKATNGQIIFTSEKYESHAAALKGIESVRKNAADDARFERKKAKDGSPYFVLKARNGESLGRSEMYKTTRSMESGIASVKKNAVDAAVADA